MSVTSLATSTKSSSRRYLIRLRPMPPVGLLMWSIQMCCHINAQPTRLRLARLTPCGPKGRYPVGVNADDSLPTDRGTVLSCYLHLKEIVDGRNRQPPNPIEEPARR